MQAPELAAEQRYVSSLYDRLDRVGEEARRQLDAVRRTSVGSTHQAKSERDAFARIWENRLRQLEAVEERLVFGRLEMEQQDGESPVHYIGRIGLRDEDQRPLLLDWRVPQARAFYQATAATPLGARARRHLTTEARTVTRIDDEVFDLELLQDGEAQVQGEAALLAALTAQRTGRMQDIVATIQAEQDRIIRSELRGALVVQGGPGTGKTAVALHRAAYLLYSHRDRLAASGVLIVGPTGSFLQYIEAVLPSLGETGVVLSTLGQLYPGVDATAEDAPEVAAVKGSRQMAGLLQRAVKSRQRVPSESQVVEIDGERITIEPHLVQDAMRRAWDSHRPHNVARVTFNKAAVGAITRQLAAQLRKRGQTIDDADLRYLSEDVRSSYDVRVLLNTAWLPLTPQKLLQDLYARPQWLAELTPRWTPAKRALLRRDRDAAFTVSDVPLLDEAAELLGEADARSDAQEREERLAHQRDVENAEAAIRNMGVEGIVDAETLAAGFQESADRATTAERAMADREWTYGHVVVDEAQELSPMQWRVLLRRSPLRSFTIVGDVAQSEAAAGARDWASALDPVFGENWRLEELTVNYRTPAAVSRAAEDVALANGLTVTRSRAVREGDWPVEVRQTAGAERDEAVVSAVRRDTDAGGTVAVIAPGDRLAALQQALRAGIGADRVGYGSLGLRREVTLLTPHEAKGLEFDSVVVVEPREILEAATDRARGAAALYVAMTRPTQRLTVVASTGLPDGLRGTAQTPQQTAEQTP